MRLPTITRDDPYTRGEATPRGATARTPPNDRGDATPTVPEWPPEVPAWPPPPRCCACAGVTPNTNVATPIAPMVLTRIMDGSLRGLALIRIAQLDASGKPDGGCRALVLRRAGSKIRRRMRPISGRLMELTYAAMRVAAAFLYFCHGI